MKSKRGMYINISLVIIACMFILFIVGILIGSFSLIEFRDFCVEHNLSYGGSWDSPFNCYSIINGTYVSYSMKRINDTIYFVDERRRE